MEMIHIRGDIIQEIIVSHFDANFGDIFDAPNKGHSPKLQRKSTWTAWIFMLLNATFW